MICRIGSRLDREVRTGMQPISAHTAAEGAVAIITMSGCGYIALTAARKWKEYNMIPVSKATLKQINRFPELYKRQALQVLHREVDDHIRVTADSFVMASILALVEEFGFGTSERATRVKRYLDKLQEVIDTNAKFYDNAVAEGLHNRLAALGIEYVMR